jgi:hypothetical protein
MKLEDKTRVLGLKKAAIILNALAESLKGETQHEAKTLIWCITWAVEELEKYKQGEVD